MVKAFTREEKDIIREKLLKKGAELLTVYGIKKTAIEDITRGVGISKGMFYSFFPSKEEFFFEVFESFEHEIKKELMTDIFTEGRDNRESLKEFIVNIFKFLDNNPMYKHINGEELEYLMRGLPEAVKEKHMKKDNDFAAFFYEKYAERGILREMKPEVISGLLRSLFFLKMHNRDIGEEVFPEVIGVYIDMIVNYLVK